jgi:integrase
MSVEKQDGRWVVRREFRRQVATEEEAKRLDRLVHAAHERVMTDFSVGLSACPTIRQLLDDYTEYLRVERGNKPATVERVKKCLERFASELSRGAGDIAVDAILPDDVIAWRRKRLGERGRPGRYHDGAGISRDVVNAEAGTLKTFARWCISHRKCGPNVAVLSIESLRVGGRENGHHIPPVMTLGRFNEIYRRLLKHAPHVAAPLKAIVLLGLRPAALFAICWKDVEMAYGAPGRIRVPALKGEVECEIVVRPGGEIDELLRDCRAVEGRILRRGSVFVNAKGHSWSTQTYDGALKWAQGRARIPNPITAYDVRHAAITWLAQAGVSEAIIQHYAKHLSVGTQKVYRHTTGELAAPAYALIGRMISGEPLPHIAAIFGESENGRSDVADKIS